MTNPSPPLSYMRQRETAFLDTVARLSTDHYGSLRRLPIVVAAATPDTLARTPERSACQVRRLALTPAQPANDVSDDHVLTAHLEFEYGGGNVFVDAPARETSNVSGIGAGNLSASSCTADASGCCNVTLTSATPGLSTVTASWNGSIATAQGSDRDMVSRFFGPQVGIDEDPVTGSAHCCLTAYWAPRLQRERLTARQISARGGELGCELSGERVVWAGDA